MKEISLHILDLAQNSIRAGAKNIVIRVLEDSAADTFVVSIADDATAKLQKFYQVVAQLMVDEACICKLIAERRFEVLLGLLRQKEQGLEEQENG